MDSTRDAIDLAARALADGRIVCFPTESSYGLAARLDRPSACARLATIKERDPASPFPVIAGSLADAIRLADSWPAAASDLAARHWPGPLTLVVRAAAGLPAEVIADGAVGVRVSSHPLARSLAALVGPITATSANRRGEPPVMTIADAKASFGDEVEYLDGGGLLGGPPSTIVSVSDEGELTLVRAGAVDFAKLV